MRLRSSATHFIETKSLPRGKLLGLAPTEASHEGFDTLIQSVPQSGKVVFFFGCGPKKEKAIPRRAYQSSSNREMDEKSPKTERTRIFFIYHEAKKQSTNTKERSVTNLTLGILYLFKIVIFSA